jgi:hypothetical protein
MRHQIQVGEFNSLNYLPEEVFNLLLRRLVLLDVLVQLSALRQLHYHKDILVRI